MKALITGASSGIGRDMAKILSEMGYDIYAVARRSEKLETLKNELKTNVYPLVYDLSDKNQCFKLFEELKDEDIEIVINNAGFGICGKFCDTEISRELEMINTNITAVHILTKLFCQKFKTLNKGRILNVASSAGYMMGPLLSAYYASKAYVLRLSQAIRRELIEDKSAVTISILCPGPVKTEFDKVANVRFSLKGLESMYVAKCGIEGMFKGKEVIKPGISIKLLLFFARFIPDTLLSKITYHIQHKKL